MVKCYIKINKITHNNFNNNIMVKKMIIINKDFLRKIQIKCQK